MDYKHNKSLVSNARNLRKNMTKEERHLWYDFLRSYPVKFLRQKIFGKYIVDFYCAEAALIIELDGSQHYEEAEMANDIERTAYLEQYGLKVLRIPNNAVNQNFRGVCEYIHIAVQQSLSQLDCTVAIQRSLIPWTQNYLPKWNLYIQIPCLLRHGKKHIHRPSAFVKEK